MTLLRVYPVAPIAGVLAAATIGAVVLLRRRKKTPEQRETLRRQRINAQGRITDGTVLDVQEFDSDTDHSVQMVIYTYDVAGVQYECSQEVTQLRQFLDLHSCRIGVATSVKYDPHHPGNSIVVAETWCGLRL
jgi:predicted aconitase